MQLTSCFIPLLCMHVFGHLECQHHFVGTLHQKGRNPTAPIQAQRACKPFVGAFNHFALTQGLCHPFYVVLENSPATRTLTASAQLQRVLSFCSDSQIRRSIMRPWQMEIRICEEHSRSNRLCLRRANYVHPQIHPDTATKSPSCLQHHCRQHFQPPHAPPHQPPREIRAKRHPVETLRKDPVFGAGCVLPQQTATEFIALKSVNTAGQRAKQGMTRAHTG